jgi:hypothetical protein
MLALFDTPEQLASEEAAESIGYATIRELLDQVGDSWDTTSDLVDELIAAEENPAADEESETEIERARLEAIRVLCMAMYGHLNSIMSTTMPKAYDVQPSDPRYMEEFRAAYGKTISAATMKTVQSAHDASHDMHTHTVALGAQCNGMKLLAAKDCPTCDGTGQVKDGSKQQDCTACDGTGILKTAEGSHDAAEEGQMTVEQKTAALKALATCGCDEAKIKALETDDQIVAAMLEHSTKSAADLAAAKAENATLKAAVAHTPTEEEFLKAAPESIRTLVENQKQQEATEKASLVTKLAAASKALTREQLEARSLEDLRTLAAFAKVEAVDYSIKGVPSVRHAASSEDFTPPNPYEAGVKALQSKVN